MGHDRRFRLDDGSDSAVVFVDRLSESLGVRGFAPVALDTTKMQPRSRAETYQFVTFHDHGLSGSTGDKLGGEKKKALEEGRALMAAKGRWWEREADHRKVRVVREALRQVRAAATARAHQAQRRRAEAAAAREEKRQRERAAAEKVAPGSSRAPAETFLCTHAPLLLPAASLSKSLQA